MNPKIYVIFSFLFLILMSAGVAQADDWYRVTSELAKCNASNYYLKQSGLYDCFVGGFTNCKIDREDVDHYGNGSCVIWVYTVAHSFDSKRRVFSKGGWSCDPRKNYCPRDLVTWEQAQTSAMKECNDSGAMNCKPLHWRCYGTGYCDFLVYGY